MASFVNKIVKYILEKRKQKLERTLAALKPKTHTNSTSKVHIDSCSTLILSAETQKKLEQLDEEVKNIVKPLLNNPNKILEFINEHGTPVHRFAQAKSVLDYINEDEGFITPLKGLKALWLNFALNALLYGKIKFSLSTREMFILREGELNIYYLLHQFYKWYGFKNNLPGYDITAQTLFKEKLDNFNENTSKELTIEEIIALKEAIARDAEAADFVINLAKANAGAKKAHKKMQQDDGAQI